MAAIQIENRTKHFRLGVTGRKVEAVKNLSLSVREGEVFAFLGLNGAGKTTTIKLLLDLVRPTIGRARLFGIDARIPRCRARVGYLPDLPHFHRFLTARELLDYAGRLFGLSRYDRQSRAERLLALVGLASRADDPLKAFSRGMLQRAALAQALINNPDLIILDEPLSGLDPVGRVELREIITAQRLEGKTVFFSSHLLDDAERIADRVAIIHEGNLLACGRLDELTASRAGWEAEFEARDGFDPVTVANSKLSIHQLGADGMYNAKADEAGSLRELYALAAEGRIDLMSVVRSRVRLEEAFLKELERWKG